MNMKEYSPFTPGYPVPVELFVGRAKQIEEIIKYVRQTSTTGKPENVFLIGRRGIGKSSLASFLRYYVSSKTDFLGVHVFLGRVSTLEEMVQLIFDKILKEVNEQASLQSLIKLFGKYIKEVGLFGISITFAPPQEDLKELVKKFPEAINNLLTKIKEQRKGLFIVLDDINGLTEKIDFANWYKSFVDEVATHFKHFPVFIMLIGLPEKRDALLSLQSSLMRIFRVVEIAKLSDEEVEKFLLNAFTKVSMEVENKAMRIMVHFSGGLPLLMHEIGDAVFWVDDDNIITEEDAKKGVIIAAQKVGEKYLDPKVYRALRSERYRSILRKLGETNSTKFNKKEIEDRLNSNEKKVFHNFLQKMKELEVIEIDKESGPGSYRYVNEIYPVYVWIQSENYRRYSK